MPRRDGLGRIVSDGDPDALARLKETTDEPLIVIPEESDARKLLEARALCCFCRNWNRQVGAQAIREQRVYERLIREERWNPAYIDARDPEMRKFGTCDVFPNSLRNGTSVAMVVRELLDTSLKGTEKGMEKVPCEFFEDRRRRGDKLSISRSGKRTLTY